MKLFFASTIILFSMSLQANSDVLSNIANDQRKCIFLYDKLISINNEIEYQKTLYIELREKIDLSNERLQELIVRRDQSKNDCKLLRVQEKCRQASQIQLEIDEMLPNHDALHFYYRELYDKKDENIKKSYKIAEDFYQICQLRTPEEEKKAKEICSSNYGKGSNYCLAVKL